MLLKSPESDAGSLRLLHLHSWTPTHPAVLPLQVLRCLEAPAVLLQMLAPMLQYRGTKQVRVITNQGGLCCVHEPSH